MVKSITLLFALFLSFSTLLSCSDDKSKAKVAEKLDAAVAEIVSSDYPKPNESEVKISAQTWMTSNLDVEKIDWNWPSKNYNRALYLRLNILTKRNQFSFIFDVRKYSIGFANLFFDYSFGSRRHEGNYIIEYCDRGFDYTFYSICSEIEKNIKYIESFNR